MLNRRQKKLAAMERSMRSALLDGARSMSATMLDAATLRFWMVGLRPWTLLTVAQVHLKETRMPTHAALLVMTGRTHHADILRVKALRRKGIDEQAHSSGLGRTLPRMRSLCAASTASAAVARHLWSRLQRAIPSLSGCTMRRWLALIRGHYRVAREQTK